jgi:cytochrome c
MVGSSIVVFIMEIIGRKKAKYDQLAYIISKTITANKSLAVVLGVGPLLCLNLLYTTYFYSANALTGQAWLSIPPLVATVFLLVYLQKYTWHKWHTGAAKKLHIAVSGLVVAMFCFIPLITFFHDIFTLWQRAWH